MPPGCGFTHHSIIIQLVYHQTTKFDNDQAVPGAALGPIGTTGIGEKLKYAGFSLAQTLSPIGSGTIPGINPQSAPNLAAFGPGDFQTLLHGRAEITSNYQDSEVAFFDLIQFFYACTTGSQLSISAVPVDCNMTVTGYTPAPASKQVGPPAVFHFSTNNGVNKDMLPAVLPSYFRGLGSAVFKIDTAVTTASAGVIDNVQNTIYGNTKVSS